MNNINIYNRLSKSAKIVFTTILALVFFASSSMMPKAYAAEQLHLGRNYLGYFSFTNTNTGVSRTMDGNSMNVSIAWRQADNGFTCPNIKIKVIRTYTGEVAYSGTLSIYNDPDGKDNDGFYYLNTGYFHVNRGSDYHIFYDAVTPFGVPGIPFGGFRRADVHTWVDLA